MTAALPEAVRVANTPIEVWHQDEARIGQQGTLTYVWAEKGARPAALRDMRRQSEAEVDPSSILLAKSSGCSWRGHEMDECGLAGPFAWRAREPRAETAEVDSGCRERVLEVRFGKPDVAGPAKVHGAGAQ